MDVPNDKKIPGPSGTAQRVYLFDALDSTKSNFFFLISFFYINLSFHIFLWDQYKFNIYSWKFWFFFHPLFDSEKMGGFEKQVKERAKELKTFFKKGVKIVGESCKKGWHKVRHMRSWFF